MNITGELSKLFGFGAPKWSGPPSGQNAGWLQRSGATPVTDVTAQFKQLLGANKAGPSQLPPDAKDQKYLLVGGLFTNDYPGYMDANVKALTGAGLDAKKVSIDTAAGVDVNAKAIRDAVLAATQDGKKVVLIGQSKGGVDVTAALALYPELKDKVRAVVAMQAPYGGTPIASDVGNCSQLKPVVTDVIGKVLHGDVRALTDLSYEARKAFIAQHPYPTDIPTVALATSRAPPRSVVGATAEYMLGRYNLPSDGLVPQVDAEIPGSKVVLLSDMDHAEGVMKGARGFANYQPEGVTLALVSLALQQSAPGAVAKPQAAGWSTPAAGWR